MRALFYDGELELREVTAPELQDGDVRVRVDLAALTGLDRELAAGRVPFRGIVGNSFVGTVEEAGGAAHQSLIGRKIVGRSSFGCGECDACRAGAENRCPERMQPGHSVANGCLAEEIVLPARAVVRVPTGVSDEAAVLAPMLATIYSALNRVKMPPWTNILVVGDGGTGILTALSFARAGFTITVRGKHGNRFDVLRRHNVHFNLVTDDAEVSGIRPGRFGPALIEYPYVVEATGNTSGWHAALTLCTPGGTVFLLSSCNDGVPRSLRLVEEKNLTVVGLREGPIEPVMTVLSTELFDPTYAVERTLTLDQWESAYKRNPNGMGGITLVRIRD